MEIACAYGDRLVQAECLFSFAEILRKRCDVEVRFLLALRRYYLQ